jgi:protein TonB
MKAFTFLLICFGFVVSGFAQTDTTFPPPPPPQKSVSVNDKDVFTEVEVEAGFPGGDEGWKNFLMKNLNVDKVGENIKFPKGKKKFIETVIVKFIVNKEGNISAVSVENKDADSNCIAEAIRVIKMSPKWTPAKQNGRVVNAYRRQPISFFFQK